MGGDFKKVTVVDVIIADNYNQRKMNSEKHVEKSN